MEEKIDSLGQLKVKALVVGPIHVAPADDPKKLDFKEVSSEAGSLEQFKGLIQAAHKKSEFCHSGPKKIIGISFSLPTNQIALVN